MTLEEAKWAFEALSAGYNEWPKVQTGGTIQNSTMTMKIHIQLGKLIGAFQRSVLQSL